MKEFNHSQFCADLIKLRGKETQEAFAHKLSIKRSTLSLLETGKQIPSIDIFNQVCSLANKTTDEYFVDADYTSIVYLMGCINESDKPEINKLVDRIQIKEKYAMLAKRSKNDFNR